MLDRAIESAFYFCNVRSVEQSLVVVYHTSSVILLAKRHLPHPINLEQIFHVEMGKAFNIFVLR